MAAALVGCVFDPGGDSGPDAASVGATDGTSGSSSSSPIPGSTSDRGTDPTTGVTSTEESSSGVEPISCSNGQRDGDETDLDCGGSCDACPDGSSCEDHLDCGSRVCLDDVCKAGTCDDGVHGIGETDVDCGGRCDPCMNGQGCQMSADCIEEICSASVCVSAECNDGILNGDESDIDCGGSCNACGIGDTCEAPPDCNTGQCVGFICGCTTPFDNGNFDAGMAGWQSTSGGCWGVGDDGTARCSSDEIQGHEMSAPINCVCTHPTVDPVITFRLRWNNDDNAFPWEDGTARLEVRLDGTIIAVVNTPDDDGEVAAITFENGASGNITSLDEGMYAPVEIQVPPFPRPEPSLSLSVFSSDRGDDFNVDDFSVQGAPCPASR